MNGASSSGTRSLRLCARLQHPGFLLDVDIRLPGQGVTALFGPSGSGKTTCLRVLAGLEPAAKGTIDVAGEVWQDSGSQVFRPVHQRAIGYVFQEASLLAHLNVEGNLKFGFQRTPVKQRRHDWDQGLALLGIQHLLPRMPHELSGGERQRVAIARALAASPRLLLMDEPLAALDSARKADILPWLERLRGELDIPVIYVSHAIDEVARLADHLVLLDEGRVLASGPTPELMTRLDLSLAHGDSASAVLACEVQHRDQIDHLTVTRFGDATLLLPWHEAAPGQVLRVRVQARDVSLALQHQQGTSILNILSATVTNIMQDKPGQVMVALQVSGSALLARVTERSARTLGLHPGQVVFAQIKGVAILG